MPLPTTRGLPYLTADESAEVMQALKHDPLTDELDAYAHAYPLEAEEAIRNVEQGYDTCRADSWVAAQL